MKIVSFLLCLVILQGEQSFCYSFNDYLKDSYDKLEHLVDSALAETKSHGFHVEGETTGHDKDHKKSSAGEFDTKHRSLKGDKEIESYDKTSSWVKKLKKSHNRKLGDEAEKNKQEEFSYSKDPDYYDDSDEEDKDTKGKSLKIEETTSRTVKEKKSKENGKNVNAKRKKKKYHKKSSKPKNIDKTKTVQKLEEIKTNIKVPDEINMSVRIEMSPKNEKITAEKVNPQQKSQKKRTKKKHIKKQKASKMEHNEG